VPEHGGVDDELERGRGLAAEHAAPPRGEAHQVRAAGQGRG
jgi:hypothetical protein